MNPNISRRSALRTLTGTTALLTAAGALSPRLRADQPGSGGKSKGRINHSVCKWCYPKVPLEDLCVSGKEIGLQSIELLEVKDFPTLKKHDLVCAMVSGVPGGITSGLNRLENHDRIVEFFERTAPSVA